MKRVVGKVVDSNLIVKVEELFLEDRKDEFVGRKGVFYRWAGESLISYCVIAQTRLVGQSPLTCRKIRDPPPPQQGPARQKQGHG
jgi:hypothetical protein